MRLQKYSIIRSWVLLGALAGAHWLHGADLSGPIADIRSVGAEGSGNAAASSAWRTLAAADVASLPAILKAMDGANDLAANWLRSAIETITDRELKAGGRLPGPELKSFLLDTQHHSRARRLAFELLARVDPEGAEKLLAGMTNDPSPELRRGAVDKIIQTAVQALADKPRATDLFQQSLLLARDVDQVDGIIKQLRTLGQTVDLPKVFGFITHWSVLGPFDNTGRKGFVAVYPPEEKIDLDGEVEGKQGRVRWKTFDSTDERGNISMNKPLGSLKNAAAYALAEFYSDQPRTVEFRLGSENSWKLWLNGQYLFGQDEYHRYKAIDQYRFAGQFRAGKNLILVKVCQNEQMEDWADGWDFQLRICDSLGTPIHSTPSQPSKAEAKP